MVKIAATIMTMDRSPRPNFLASTVDSLLASGTLDDTAFSLSIIHSGSPTKNLDDLSPNANNLGIYQMSERLHYNLGVIQCLRQACALEPDFVLFMEDDIEVCDDFPDYIVSVLKEFGADPVLDFITYYDEVKQNYLRGERCFDMASDSFYGGQCYAMTPENALSFANFVEQNHGSTPGFADTWFDPWLKSLNRPRTIQCAIPSAAQHTGIASTHGHEYMRAPGYKMDLEKITPQQTGDYLLVDTEKQARCLQHKTNGSYLEINESAYLIYLYCDGTQSIGKIVSDIRTETGLDQALLSAQIRQGLHTLKHNGVIDY